jgi:CRP/FNR family transcriptional regulator
MNDHAPALTEADWLAQFPQLQSLDDPAWLEVLKHAQPMTVPAGTVVFHEGDQCNNYLLVLDGSVRVQKVSMSGREIILYRVESGDSCVLTTSCLLAGDLYPAEGIAETEVKAVAIPVQIFRKGMAESEGFRQFVLSAYGQRISNLIVLVEEVAFGRVDVRLAQCLLRHARHGTTIQATHQDLAAELGSAREVISRQLKEFERNGWVALHRGRLDVLDSQALRELASSLSDPTSGSV